jgi:hypothetical protein
MSQTTFNWLLLAIVLAIPSVLAVGRVIDWMRRRSKAIGTLRKPLDT